MILFNLEYCLLLTFVILQLWDVGCENNDYMISVPTEVTAQVGLCVHIPCSFTVPSTVTISRSAKGFWYRPSALRELVAWNNNEGYRGRMFFTGEVSKKDCSLFINDVQKSDDNSYQFRLDDYVKYSYVNIIPRLKVKELTDKPEISVGKLVAGKKATIMCKSPGICAGSAPGITWNGKDGELSTFDNHYPNNTNIYFSSMTFTPSKRDNGSPLVCKVSFLHRYTTEQRIILNVEYPPEIIITFGGSAMDDTFIVKEGDTKIISCMVDSNPLAAVTWFVGDEVKKGPTNGETLMYSLTNISLSDAGKYLCSGKNDHGTIARTIEIIVHYAPRTPNIICQMNKDCIIDKQHMVYVMENSTLSLLCTAESLPTASLSWETSGPRTRPTTFNGQLIVHNVSFSDERPFTCVATNDYGKSEFLVNVRVTYKPRTIIGKDSTCWERGSHLECVCIIQSFPNPNIEWSINEKLYGSNHSDNELNILTVTINLMTISTLNLKLSWTKIRSIQCMGSNQHGRLELLLKEYRYNIEIIAAVSSIAVIVLLFIGGFLVMYYRKKKLAMKAEEKEINTDDDCSVIYTNSEVQPHDNQTTKIGNNSVYSVEDDSDNSLYMNVEDVQYMTINFSKLKAKDAPENDEIQYAEIKK